MNVPLIIGIVERKSVVFARVFVSKKTFVFDWDKSLQYEGQYSNVLSLSIDALREQSPSHSIEVVQDGLPLPESFEYEGKLYILSVERNK